jgi:hypothetical protein
MVDSAWRMVRDGWCVMESVRRKEEQETVEAGEILTAVARRTPTARFGRGWMRVPLVVRGKHPDTRGPHSSDFSRQRAPHIETNDEMKRGGGWGSKQTTLWSVSVVSFVLWPAHTH